MDDSKARGISAGFLLLGFGVEGTGLGLGLGFGVSMELGLAGRAVLLVGAGRGIGAAAALAASREGAKVGLVARTAADVEARAKECAQAGAEKVLAMAADATDGAQLDGAIERTAREFGGIDALVTLVGGSQPGGTAELTDADWQAAYGRNLWPAVRASRAALPHLSASAARRGFVHGGPSREASVIVHVASVWRSEEHTSELQSHVNLVCRLLLEKKKETT